MKSLEIKYIKLTGKYNFEYWAMNLILEEHVMLYELDYECISQFRDLIENALDEMEKQCILD